jgi:hypothetical protein
VPDRAQLENAAYDLAEAFRDGRWPGLADQPREAVWAFLVGELSRRCPGFAREDYDAALNQGFTDSR